MEIIKTPISDLFIIKPKVFNDTRGYFFESYNYESYKKMGIETVFVQDNEAYSTYGVIRGLHFQLNPYAQAKLARVSKGKVLDVAVDLRKKSPTFGKHFSIELSEENKLQLFIPKGFAHGYSVLSEEAVFIYKCDNVYQPDYESSIIFNDPELNIDWKVPEENRKVSAKDLLVPSFKNARYNF